MEEEMHPEQVRALRKLTPAQRLELGLHFNEQIQQLRAAMLRVEHPDWAPEQIKQAMRHFVLNAES